jgi:hypothetical protein
LRVGREVLEGGRSRRSAPGLREPRSTPLRAALRLAAPSRRIHELTSGALSLIMERMQPARRAEVI